MARASEAVRLVEKARYSVVSQFEFTQCPARTVMTASRACSSALRRIIPRSWSIELSLSELSLASFSIAVAIETASARLRRNMPDPVPVAVLGRLAVEQDFQ